MGFFKQSKKELKIVTSFGNFNLHLDKIHYDYLIRKAHKIVEEKEDISDLGKVNIKLSSDSFDLHGDLGIDLNKILEFKKISIPDFFEKVGIKKVKAINFGTKLLHPIVKNGTQAYADKIYKDNKDRVEKLIYIGMKTLETTLKEKGIPFTVISVHLD